MLSRDVKQSDRRQDDVRGARDAREMRRALTEALDAWEGLTDEDDDIDRIAEIRRRWGV